MRKDEYGNGDELELLRVGSSVRVVVTFTGTGTGTGRAVEVIKVAKISDDDIYIEGLKSPFSRSTGICRQSFLPGMLVMLECIVPSAEK